MPTGEAVAVKVLGANSRQGEQEFLTEVIPDDMLMLLSICLHLYVHVIFFESLQLLNEETSFLYDIID